MRIYIFLFICPLFCFSLSAQDLNADLPIEILYEARDLSLDRLVPQWKSTFQRDYQGNPLYEARFVMTGRPPEGPRWELERESWSSYFISGNPETRYTVLHSPNRTTIDEVFNRTGTLRKRIQHTYAAENGEMIESILVEKTHAGSFELSSTTSYLDFSTDLYVPHNREAFSYTPQAQLKSELYFSWNQTAARWDTVSKVSWQYLVDTDSTVIRETLYQHSGGVLWQLTHLSRKRYDTTGRILEEEAGSDQIGFARSMYGYDDVESFHTITTDTMVPGGSWVPLRTQTSFFSSNSWEPKGLLKLLIEETKWDQSREAFNRVLSQSYGYQGDGKLSTTFRRLYIYEPASGREIQTSENIRYSCQTYCDGKLQRETVGPNANLGGPFYQTSYTYAQSPACGDSQSPFNMRVSPNPIGSGDPFLRLESTWLINPNVKGEILDLMGRRHARFAGRTGFTQDLVVKNLLPGTYIIHLYYDGERQSISFVKTD